MRRRLAVVALILLAALPLWAVAQEAITYYSFGYNPVTRSGGFVRSVVVNKGANSDTVTGPMVPVQGARRAQFKVIALSANQCSLAYIQVTMKDTSEAALQTHALWVDANGLSGLSIVDNMTSQNFSDSLGGRTFELLAPGSGRIPWVYARCVFRMKAGGIGTGSTTQAIAARWEAQVQRD